MKSLFNPVVLIVLVVAVVVLAVVYQNPGLLPGQDEPATENQAAVQPDVIATQTDSVPRPESEADRPGTSLEYSLDADYLERLLASVDRGQREQLLMDEQAFRQFVRQEADNRSILAAAYANKLHEDEAMVFLMQRGAESVLRETYLNQLMLEQLPADFPTREQAREFYEQNPDQFQIGERIEVWQVFLQIDEGADQETMAAVEKQARDISQQIQEGELDIARAAAQYSAHASSRRNAGFMGQVRVADLKPEIARVLGELDTGAIGLARSDDGWHVLKKGEMIPPEKLEFEQIEDQVSRLLVNRARQEFRNAVYQQARRAYPQDDLSEERIEEWRRELRGQSATDWAR